jgi:hypothetical protein
MQATLSNESFRVSLVRRAGLIRALCQKYFFKSSLLFPFLMFPITVEGQCQMATAITALACGKGLRL